MNKLKIRDMRPTQLTVGRAEVEMKVQEIKVLSGHELEMKIASKPVPVVLGPGGERFITDHHHEVTAMHLVGIEVAVVTLIADFSSWSLSDFWQTMEDKRWAYPYDGMGRRRPFTDFPTHIWKLDDDIFRSLAAFVQRAGGYEKTQVPLEEFRWADLLRTNLSLPEGEPDFTKLTKQGVKISRSKAALGLPGFAG